MTELSNDVKWITGRADALISAVALSMCEARGERWFDLSIASRVNYVQDAEGRVADWVANDVLLEFSKEYRERDVVDDAPFKER